MSKTVSKGQMVWVVVALAVLLWVFGMLGFVPGLKLGSGSMLIGLTGVLCLWLGGLVAQMLHWENELIIVVVAALLVLAVLVLAGLVGWYTGGITLASWLMGVFGIVAWYIGTWLSQLTKM